MTGFAEKRFDSKTLSVRISIKSLNHRFLDWNYRGAQINEVEHRLREICQNRIRRGRIDVYLDVNFLNPSAWELRINENLLLKIISSFEKLSSRMKKGLNFSVENIFKLPQIVELKRKRFNKEEIAFLERSFEKTLDELLRMRKREGEEVRKEIRSHIRTIRQAANRIEKLAKKHPSLIRDRLVRRMEELDNKISLSEDRIAEEAAYLAQRYDLTEEVKRMKCHLDLVRELLSPENEEPMGKKLDFIAQEIFREANTLNSKSQDIDIIRESLTIKGEVESIRQQVQNLE
jgi:uncharacterized protein (TIGR00255 family)